MKRPEKRTVILLILISALLLLTAMIAAVRLNAGFEMVETVVGLIDTHTPTPIFIALLVVLPIFGFPLSPFLMVLGMKFDFITAGVLLALSMPVHFAATFALAGLADKTIGKILAGRGYVIPRITPRLHLRFSFLVAMTPVAPYAVKNYLLPLAGVPFRTYLVISWPCQFVLAMPMVVLGSSLADMNPALFGVAMVAFVMIYLIISRVEKKMGRQVNLKTTVG